MDPDKEKPSAEEPPVNSPSYSFFMSGDVLDAATDPNPPELSEEELAAEEERKAEEERRRKVRERNAGRGFGSIMDDDDDGKEEEPEKKDGEEEEPPEKKPEKDEEEEEEDPPEKPRLKVSKAFPAGTEQPKPAAKPAEPEQKEEPEPEPTKPEPTTYELTDEDRALIDELPEEARDAAYDALDLWKEAARVDGEKYGKQFDQWKKFFREDAQRRQKVIDRDPDADPEEDPQYTSWRKRARPQQPSKAEARKIEHEILLHQAEERAYAKLSEETKDLREWKQREEIKERALPEIQRTSSEFNQSFVEELKGDDVLGDFIEKYLEAGEGEEGFAAAREEFGDTEADLIADHYRSGLHIVQTMVACRQGLEKYSPDNPVHQEAAQRIYGWENALANDPKRRVRDGKEFAPWGEYVKLPPEEREKHWTLTSDQLSRMMRAEVKQRLKTGIKAHRERLEAELERIQRRKGGTPAPKAPDPSSENREQEEPSAREEPVPRSRPTRVPAAGNSGDSGQLSPFWSGARE